MIGRFGKTPKEVINVQINKGLSKLEGINAMQSKLEGSGGSCLKIFDPSLVQVYGPPFLFFLLLETIKEANVCRRAADKKRIGEERQNQKRHTTPEK